MSLFNSNYLNDEEIWKRINDITAKRRHIQNQLAKPEVSTDLDKMPQLSKRFHKLNRVYPLIVKLKDYLADLKEVKELLDTNNKASKKKNELQTLYQDYKRLCSKIADNLYQLLIDEGYLNEEIEDKIDIQILKYIEYMGPEYAAMLSTKMKLDIEKTRRRLDILLDKKLLERVQGTMLDNYHRKKDWTKHMNHTYYKLSRKGKLYLRNLYSDSEEVERLLANYN
ncbi:DUF2250 domain-containing protein [Sporohalobacter salinus]|uniref:DUF2250 domain-containing protein n=1 Tax=Sporohalobacter salinus TaxID=1494606 RepID=UPI0019612759|nr:DUF2250 domain-containing protein [Sporohalobacter salinus]MBM7623182.1 putative transcriptional regulator [Sporohalobacter salinus]